MCYEFFETGFRLSDSRQYSERSGSNVANNYRRPSTGYLRHSVDWCSDTWTASLKFLSLLGVVLGIHFRLLLLF
jgi:hypothetical protein